MPTLLVQFACFDRVWRPDDSVPPEDTAEPVGELIVADQEWWGEDELDGAGYALEAGDLDADGLAEVLVGAPSTGLFYGPEPTYSAAYLVAGDAMNGALADVAQTSFPGWKTGDVIGQDVAFGGDLTGDGANDVVIGGEASEDPPVTIQIYAGPLDAELVVDAAYARITFVRDVDYPSFVAECGDVDGDNDPELCVGSIAFVDAGSEAFIFRGPLPPGDMPIDSADVRLSAPIDELAGEHLEGGSDVSGDGLPDLLVGAEGYNSGDGGVYVVADPPDGVGDLHDYPFHAGASASNAGNGLAMGGDIDGDGLGDFFVGGNLYDERAGRGWIVTAATERAPLESAAIVLEGTQSYDWLGIDAALADLDGDGLADLAVGIPRDWYFGFDLPGRVAIFGGPVELGQLTEADATIVIRGSDAADSFGARLATGDTDGNGVMDLLVAAVNDSQTASQAGRIYMLLNAPWSDW